MPNGASGTRGAAPSAPSRACRCGHAAIFSPEPPPAPPGRINVTDPGSDGQEPQAVTTEDRIIVAADVIGSGEERWQLEPMLDHALGAIDGAGLHPRPRTVLADAGFFIVAQIHALTAASSRWSRRTRPGERPPGMTRRTPIYQRMRDTLDTDEGRALYRRRAQIIEPVFAQIEVGRRADRFQRRGRVTRADLTSTAVTGSPPPIRGRQCESRPGGCRPGAETTNRATTTIARSTPNFPRQARAGRRASAHCSVLSHSDSDGPVLGRWLTTWRPGGAL